MRILHIALMTSVLTAAGCGGSSAVKITEAQSVNFDPAAAVQSLMTAVDANKDGAIDASEAAKAPGLAAAFTVIDRDNSHTLTVAELMARFELYTKPVASSMPLSVYIQLDGNPLKDVVVTLEPEPAFAGTHAIATATTDDSGRAWQWAVNGGTAVGLSAGLYRIKAVHDSLGPQYNTTTTLGCEVYTDGRGGEIGIYLNLSAR